MTRRKRERDINGKAQEFSHASLEASEYEQSREQRIKENLERMRKLGIFDLSLKVKADSLSKNSRNRLLEERSSAREALPPPSGSPRRSSRLQNPTLVSYSEVHLTKKGSTGLVNDADDLLLERGAKPEIYTEEHEKLLGHTQRSWTLFVDGYGSDGKKIYDSVKGKTCHQCRQKTLGLRTNCSQCQMVQGQFCGDCLYIRYGEHVMEANENPEWICPVCRGICNCSLCRQAKGWPPTGPLYRRTLKLGFKSVAHYLIQNNRASSDPATKNDDTPRLAKKSLSSSDMKNEGGSKEEDPAKPVGSQLTITIVDDEDEDNGVYALSKKDGETYAACSGHRRPYGVAGRTRKRSDGGLFTGNEVREKIAVKDIIALSRSSSVQDSIASRLRPRSRKS